MIEIPFDTVEAVATPDWRNHAAWPQPVMMSYQRGRNRIGALLRTVSAINDEEPRHVAILASCRMLTTALPLLELAYALDAQDERGMRIIGNHPVLSYMRGDDKFREAALGGFSVQKSNKNITMPFLRHVARTASWTPWQRLPATLLKSQVTALSHNRLLVDAACQDDRRIDFRHGELVFNKAVSNYSAKGIKYAGDLVPLMLDVLGADEDISEALRERWRHLASDVFLKALEKAELDLNAVRSIAKLPDVAWLGSGGRWANRALGIEVRRRGGHVTCFDHGHNRSIHGVYEWPALLEMLVADCLVVPTKALADRYMAAPIRELLPPGRSPEFDSLGFASDLRTHTAPTQNHSSSGRLKVVYAPGIMRGFRTTIPAPLPDILYFDLQMHVAQLLDGLPVDVFCRPHPEGSLRGRRHPLENIFQLADQNFEQLVKKADVFVFDDPHSRVFCQALITDRPIVFLDIGVPYFDKSILPIIEKRCTVLRLEEDERGRRMINRETFEEAIRNPKVPEHSVLALMRRMIVDDEAS